MRFTSFFRLLAVAIAGLLFANRVSIQTYKLEANLGPHQEVPPHNTPAYSDAILTLNVGTGTISINPGAGTYNDLLAGAITVGACLTLLTLRRTGRWLLNRSYSISCRLRGFNELPSGGMGSLENRKTYHFRFSGGLLGGNWIWALAAVLAVNRAASAGTAEGDLFGGSDLTSVLINGASTNLYSFSQLAKPAAVGPNNSSSYTDNNADPRTVSPVPVVPGKQVVITSGIPHINSNTAVYTPVVGMENIPKPAQTDTQSVSSFSRDNASGAQAFGFSYFSGANQLVDYVYASGTLTPPTAGGVAVGAAGASASDPGNLAPATYEYDDLTLDATLQLDNNSEVAGLNFFALDSRLTDVDTFYDADVGEPLNQALWSLNISIDQVPQSPSDVSVNFQVNPMARSLGILNPTLSDSQIQAEIVNSLTVTDGEVQLSDFQIFPTGTTYTTYDDQQGDEVEYSYNVDAGMETVPEPTGLAILALGVIGGSLRRRVGRK